LFLRRANIFRCAEATLRLIKEIEHLLTRPQFMKGTFKRVINQMFDLDKQVLLNSYFFPPKKPKDANTEPETSE